MAADGYDFSHEAVIGVTASDVHDADVVASFEPLSAHALLATARDWSDTPAMSANYNAALAIMTARIDGLLDELAKRRC
jgi:hypothetical protein